MRWSSPRTRAGSSSCPNAQKLWGALGPDLAPLEANLLRPEGLPTRVSATGAPQVLRGPFEGPPLRLRFGLGDVGVHSVEGWPVSFRGRALGVLLTGHTAPIDDETRAITWRPWPTIASSCAAPKLRTRPGRFECFPTDLVLQDYQLARGNSLSCLIRLRRSDPLVPIIAISEVASEEIAAKLLQAGLDDYINKKDLTSQVLGASLRPLLTRTLACRERIAGSRPETG
ncbi:MAG TPA: response regulator [Isosphaeraceae bacterium]|nr:response regulator [Isosphaeraceae bacterium]